MSLPRKSDLHISRFDDHLIITQPNPLRAALRRDELTIDDAVARAEAALADLSCEFIGWMTIETNRLAEAHEAIRTSGVSPATQGELFRAAHDIKGDAATFGFPAAGQIADSLCRVIEHAPDLAAVPDELIAHHVNAIQAIVREQPMIGNDAIGEELNRKLRGVSDAYLAQVNRDRPDHLQAILAPSIAPTA